MTRGQASVAIGRPDVGALLALAATALLSAGCYACGESQQGAVPYTRGALTIKPASTSAESSHVRGDADDDDTPTHVSPDDRPLRRYGHPADKRDAQAILTLIKRYYTAAGKGDGAAACSLLVSHLASRRDLGETAERYAPAPGVPSLIGKSCPYIMNLLFKEHRRQLMSEGATLQVNGLRVSGRHGIALLAFASMPERQMPVERDTDTWRIGSPISDELP